MLLLNLILPSSRPINSLLTNENNTYSSVQSIPPSLLPKGSVADKNVMMCLGIIPNSMSWEVDAVDIVSLAQVLKTLMVSLRGKTWRSQ